MNDTPLENLGDPFALTKEEVKQVRADIVTELDNNWLWSDVTKRLTLGVFHVTGVQGWTGIRQAGSILPNRGERAPMFEQSRECRGWEIGGVCLFDLETPCIELVADQFDKVNTILLQPGRPKLSPEEEEEDVVRVASSYYLDPDSNVQPTPCRPIVFIQFGDRERLPGPWEYWHRSVEGCVPYLECWHKAPMPLSAASAFHVVRQDEVDPKARWREFQTAEEVDEDLQ